MQHYKVEYQDGSSLDTLDPHDPVDFDASLASYLESMLADGWTFAGVIQNGSTAGHFIFSASGRNT